MYPLINVCGCAWGIWKDMGFAVKVGDLHGIYVGRRQNLYVKIEKIEEENLN